MRKQSPATLHICIAACILVLVVRGRSKASLISTNPKYCTCEALQLLSPLLSKHQEVIKDTWPYMVSMCIQRAQSNACIDSIVPACGSSQLYHGF